MVDKLGLGTEVRELKLGSSFTNPRESAFHTLRYDFKPASVDINKMATIDVGTNSQITVTVPPNTVFKGSAKPYQKQCIVIVNTKTGEITLEKLTCNIQVKKTRSENRNKPSTVQKVPTLDQFPAPQKGKKQGPVKSSNSNNPSTHNTHSSHGSHNSHNPHNTHSTHGSHSSHGTHNTGGTSQNIPTKPNTAFKAAGGKNKPKTQTLSANLGNMLPKHSPLHASPNRKSPNPVRFSPSQPPSNCSLPRIGLDDQFPDDWFCPPETNKFHSPNVPVPKKKVVKPDVRSFPAKPETEGPPIAVVERSKPALGMNHDVGELSDSSTTSSSSSSGDSSDSSSDSEDAAAPKKIIRQNDQVSPFASVPDNLLKEDLQLSSESGSESD